jgi:hypothetical protein
MNLEYVVENDSERHRMFTMLDALSDDDLQRPLGNGLIVAAALIHLAFWDDYRAALLAQWVESGFAPARSNFDALNSAITDVASVVPASSVVGLAKRAADAADQQIELVDSDLAAAIVAGGSERILRSSLHRRLHLDQIELAVGITL